MTQFARTLLCLVFSSSVFGCGETLESLTDRLPTHDDDTIQLAVLGMHQGSLETALLAALAADVSIDAGESEMAEQAATRAREVFSPASCVEAVATGPAVSLLFRDCEGPFGISGLDGGANLAFAGEGDSTAVILTSGSIDINGTSLGLNTTGLMSDNSEGERSWELQTSGAGISGRDPVSRLGQFMGRLDGDCLVLRGHWTATIGGAVYPTSFTGFTRCDNPCPSAGTMVLGEVGGSVDDDGRAMTLTFVGTETVAWVSSDRRVGTTSLKCSGDGE